TSEKSLARTLSQCRMIDRVINLEEIFAKPFVKFSESPGCMLTWIHRFRHLANISCHLRVTQQVVDKLRIACSEHALADRPKTRLRGRPGLLRRLVACQQSFEVYAVELRPTVDHENLWQSGMAAYAFSQHHHAGAVAWLIKTEIDRQDAAAESIGEEGNPRT